MKAVLRFAAGMMASLAAVMAAEPAAPKERQLTAESKVDFREMGAGAYYLDFTGKDGKKQSVYWPEGAPDRESLSKERSYTIDYSVEVVTPEPGAAEVLINAELRRFRDGEKVLYDASVCRTHGLAMERKAVPIIWGLPRFVPGEMEARRKDFPNAGLANGGCMPMPDRPLAWKWVCPTCKEKEAAFKKSVAVEK